jgi:protein gp37
MANWNPWHGCRKFSEGCLHCYVYRTDARYERDASLVYRTGDFDLPMKKKRDGSFKIPAGDMVWTCFTSDFLLEEADEWRPEAWDMIRARSDLRFFFITKRILRLESCLPPDWGGGWEHVHICCTVENQCRADERLPVFRTLPVRHKSIACEPLLGSVDLSPYLGTWAESVAAGGESGPAARICDYEWVLDLHRQCEQAGVPFCFRQTGARFVRDGRLYRIDRKYQHSQARRAGIDFNPGRKNP